MAEAIFRSVDPLNLNILGQSQHPTARVDLNFAFWADKLQGWSRVNAFAHDEAAGDRIKAVFYLAADYFLAATPQELSEILLDSGALRETKNDVFNHKLGAGHPAVQIYDYAKELLSQLEWRVKQNMVASSPLREVLLPAPKRANVPAVSSSHRLGQ